MMDIYEVSAYLNETFTTKTASYDSVYLQENVGSVSTLCRDVYKLNVSDWCSFVNDTKACKIVDGFIDYTHFLYCGFTKTTLAFGAILLVVWLLFLFIAMAVAADDFLCPPIVVIAKLLRMSDNIAGVTLLAFGNGAADVFSSIAAIRSSHGSGDIGLAIGSLLGAGILLTTVIAGVICIIKPCHMAERPFLRDVSFFILAVFMLFFVLYDKKVTLMEAIGFVIVYAIYAIIVVVGRYIYQKHKKHKLTSVLTEENQTNGDEDFNESTNELTPPEDISGEEVADLEPILSIKDHAKSSLQEFLVAISPINVSEFMAARWFTKIYLIFKLPALMILTIAVPVVDSTKPKRGWNRHLNALHCITTPLLGVLLAEPSAFLYMLGGKFPIYGLILLLGTALAVAVLFTSKNSDPPVYHSFFAFLGFAGAVVWIDALATEIVNSLTTIGIVVNISSAVLGLTLLAWGNSVADFIADFVMAMKGYPRAGLSACYGGPLFNILLGIGLPFILTDVAKGTQIIDFTLVQVILIACLLFILAATLVIVPLQKFVVGKQFGIFLISFYGLFLLLVLLAETGVIKGHV